jgi:hypothetical protein
MVKPTVGGTNGDTWCGLGFEGKRDFTASWTNGRDFEIQLETREMLTTYFNLAS